MIIHLSAAAPAPPMSRLPVFCVVATLATFIPAVVLVMSAFHVAQFFGLEDLFYPRDASRGWIGVVFSALFASAVETLFIAFFVSLFRDLFKVGHGLQIVGTAAVAGAAHGIGGDLLWVLSSFWAFLVFTYSFILWRQHSKKAAFLAAMVPHCLTNVIAGSLAVLST